MRQATFEFSNTKGPSKPPLPNPLNLLSSIPNSAINSAQFASIANVALQNIISTPPPSLPQLLHSQPNPYICNTNFKLPPGLPIPLPLMQQQFIAATSIPNTMSSVGNSSANVSPIPNTIINPMQIPLASQFLLKSNTNNFSNNINTLHNININNINIGGIGAPTKTTKLTASKSRKRGKRGGSKKKEITKDAGIRNVNLKETNVTKRNLINAIELERRNHELTRLRLCQLHQHYGEMLVNLKKESVGLKNKVIVLKNGPTQKDLEAILKQKQSLRDDYLRKRSIRVKDEQQLKQTNKENQKLVIIIHYLKQQMDALLVQYQSLCQMQANSSKHNQYSDAQRIVNNLDSLDIVDAESMVNQENNKILNQGTTSGVMSQRVFDDPWFQKIIEENRMLERHIRFLRHIIERETQRCNFKEIIVGKKLISLQKPAEKKVDIH